MLGTIVWNHGSLGNVAAYNVISWSTTVGSAASTTAIGRQMVEAGAHTGQRFSGTRQLGFIGDFYFRFHITTTYIDLGNLVSDQTTSLVLWNAYLSGQRLVDLTTTNAEGLTVSGQPSPPLAFAPLQQRSYDLAISVDGPATIDADIIWTFSNGDVIAVDVVGSRIVGWTWPPNWSEGMLERLEWRTDVIQAYQGQEQRRSLRIGPRQGLEFAVSASGDARRHMEGALWNWGARTWAVPLWMDGMELTSTLASGATSIPLNTSQRSFAVGELVMLMGSTSRSFEVIEILTIGATIGLKRPTTQAWGAGTRVYPARSGRLVNTANLSRFSGTDSTLRVQFEMVDPYSWTASASPTYRSYPVLETLPDWGEEPSLAIERKADVIDAGIGPILVDDRAQMPLTVQRNHYTLTTRAAINTWKQRLFALRGKASPVWLPTWSDDMTVVVDIGSSATVIDVNWIGYTRYIQNDPNRRDIRIQLKNGTVFYRRILTWSELTSTVERLGLDSALGVNVTTAEIALVSFLTLTRSDTDAHELAYFTGDAAETVFPGRTFRHDL